MLTREQWMASQGEQPPFGLLPVAGREAAIRWHTTSGTTGREPIRVLDTAKDWAWQAEMWCYGLWGFGVRQADTAYVAFGYGSFIGFWGLHYGLEKLGALNVPGGAQPTEGRVRQIVDFGATVVASTPTYALRLAQEAERLGVDLAASGVRRLILSGEPAGSIPQTKALIERLWGAKAGDTAGMTEIGTIMIFECSHQPGGTHIIEDHFIEEVVDPASGEPVGYGEAGERVVTSFGRGIIPLLRYRTADLVAKVPASRCGCGRGFDLYEGGILGRVDDMKLVRGTNVYPRAVEGIVREFPAVEEFQLLLTREGHFDRIALRVEPAPGTSEEAVGRHGRTAGQGAGRGPRGAAVRGRAGQARASCPASSSRPGGPSTGATPRSEADHAHHRPARPAHHRGRGRAAGAVPPLQGAAGPRRPRPLRPGRGPGGHRRALERGQRPRPGARAAARPGRLTMPVSERHSKLVYDALVAAGVEVVSALPETWLVHLIRLAEDDPERILVRLAKEEEGVGVSAGAHLAGRKAAMLMQNHGLLQSVNGIVSLAQLYKIPLLMLISDRGHLGEPDPWQTEGGRATRPILDALGIVTDELRDPASVQLQVARGMTLAQASLAPVALLLTRDLMWEALA